MSFIPSCDDREDAIRSLSEIYAVPTQEIKKVLRAREVRKIAKRYSEIDTPGFHFVVGYLLGASPRSDITHACYYHSTSYGGCSSWFDEGLHGSSQGVGSYLDKITELLPPEVYLEAKQTVRGIVERRSNDESSTADKCGPYAWNTFTAASSSKSGVSFRVPEAIRDMCSLRIEVEGEEVDLSAIILERLKPVVVKFKGKISDIDDYSATLWAYLLSDGGECHLTHTFIGDGLSVPRKDIIALIDVS